MSAEDPGWIDEPLLRALGEEVMRISGRRATTYDGSVLESSAFRILWLLEERGPRTLRGLADELQLDQSTVNRQVNAALRRGLLERYAEDGVSGRLVRPTDAGRAAYLHDGQLRADVLTVALQALGADRATTMLESLRAFNDAFDRAHDHAHDRAPGEGRPQA